MRILSHLIVLILMFASWGIAKEQSFNVNEVIAKMQKELNLTDQQAIDIKPILEENVAKCQAFLEIVQSEASIKKSDVKSTLKQFRQEENDKLSKVLSEEQMKKLINKQNVKDALNRDKINFAESLEQSSVMIGQGASLQF